MECPRCKTNMNIFNGYFICPKCGFKVKAQTNESSTNNPIQSINDGLSSTTRTYSQI